MFLTSKTHSKNLNQRAMTNQLATAQYIVCGSKKLRCGFTTGSAAAMAAKAASRFLLLGDKSKSVSITTPKGWLACADIIFDESSFKKNCVRVGVKKDAGDDPDATDGIEVFATVTILEKTASDVEIIIDGGKGVGRVTKEGLDQAVGNAAINSTPRKMIEKEVREAAKEAHFSGKIEIIIDIPNGEEIAKKTFNKNLGITGGLSVIGTTGVVEPMSEQALIDALCAEINVIEAEQQGKKIRAIIVTPGEYGLSFLKGYKSANNLEKIAVLKCSNYIGAALDLIASKNFTHVFIAGHAGKFVKLAGGIFSTHSRTADCRLELVAAHAALSGANRNTVAAIMECATVDAALEVLDKAVEVNTESVLESLEQKIEAHLERRIQNAFKWAFLMFTNVRGIISSTKNIESFFKEMSL